MNLPARGGRPAAGPVDPFAALADPTRRVLLERLASGEKSAGQLADGLPVSKAAVSQHLRTLLSSGMVGVRVDGRHRRYRLRPERFAALRDWLDGLDRFWKERVDALGHHLDRTATGDRTAKRDRREGGDRPAAPPPRDTEDTG